MIISDYLMQDDDDDRRTYLYYEWLNESMPKERDVPFHSLHPMLVR